jgi:hypothetical protein
MDLKEIVHECVDCINLVDRDKLPSEQATYVTIIQCMCYVCCIPKATNTHSQYVIHIAFPLQQWLQERT